MAKITLSILFFFCFVQCLSIVRVYAHLVPALYVFGDSLSDNGNDIFLPEAKAKAIYKPYGIDFPNGTFGRFTNGFTLAEHLAFLLELPLSLPILDPHSQTTDSTDGFNYASSFAGILSDTGVKITGSNLYLGKQVQMFKKTAQEFLVSRLGDKEAIRGHLRKSIYFIQIGSNDYILNYVNSTSSKNGQIYNPEQFAELLVLELGRQVQELYDLEARRFVVSEIGPLGCTPAAIKLSNQQTKCVEQVNSLVSFFNVKLADKITELKKTLVNSSFVTMKAEFLAQLIKNPTHYGFEDTVNPCCTVENNGVECAENVPPCQKRQSHVFFDGAHPSDAANKLMAKACFEDNGACSPINIHQLLQQPIDLSPPEKSNPGQGKIDCKKSPLFLSKKGPEY